jgi:hypothetical protein
MLAPRAFVPLALLAATTAHADIIRPDAVVARSGYPAPGVPNATFGPVGTGALECVSRGGNVAFRTELQNTTQFVNEALYAWERSTQSLRLVVREGDPATNWPVANASFASFGRVAIDDSARALFTSNPRDLGSPTPGPATGIWRQQGSAAPTLVLREGATIAPISPNPINSFDELGPFTSDGSLSFLFLEGNVSLGNARFAILRADNSVDVLLRANQTVPWGTGQLQISAPPMPAAANAGPWLGRSRAGTGSAVLLRRLAASEPTPLVFAGDTLPGSAQSVFSLGAYAINDAGTAVASFNLANLQSGIYRFPVGSPPHVIAQTGSQGSTPFGVANFVQVGVGITNIALNNAGDVVFVASANIPTLGTVSSLWFSRPGESVPRLIAAPGSFAQRSTVLTTPTNGFGLDELGRVVLNANVAVTPGGPSRRAVLTWTPVSNLLNSYAISDEDGVLFGVGDGQSLSDATLALSLASGGSGYAYRPMISSDGLFFWQATFLNGSSAIIGGQFGTECGSLDFNRNGLFPEDEDLIDFLNVLAGGTCSTQPPAGNGCDPIDYNNDGLFPDDSDLIAYLAILAGGACPP